MPPPAPKYYPTLGNIITLDQLPDSLGFIKDGITAVLNEIYYKDFQSSRSQAGDIAFYSLSFVSKKKIGFPIVADISFVLNPDQDDDTISSFPFTLQYNWPVLAYLSNFDLADFSYSLEDFYKLGLALFNVTEEQVISTALDVFVVPVNSGVDNMTQFVADINQILSTNIQVPQVPDQIGQLVDDIYAAAGEYPSYAVFLAYLFNSVDLEDTKTRIQAFFDAFIPDDFEVYIRNLILPNARATFEVSAALEFPRNILQPVYNALGQGPNSTSGPAYGVIPEDANGFPKVLLKFGEVLLYADTELGLGYNAELALSTSVPAMIGKTGLIIDIQSLKLDLSETNNIPEADADGRPATFMGVYIKEATVIFPNHWTANSSNLVVKGTDMLIGNEGGISGEFKVAGQNMEAYVSYTVGGIGSIAVNPTLGEVVVTGTGPGETKTFPYEVGKEMYIRDKTNQYFKINSSGAVSAQPTASTAPILQFTLGNSMVIKLYSFYLKLHQNEVVCGSVVGELSGSPLNAPIRITLEFDHGLIIKADVPNGLPIYTNSNIEIKLDGLQFGKSHNQWVFGIAGRVDIKKEIPVVSKFLPQYFHLYKLFYSKSTGFEFDLEAKWKNGTIVRGNDTAGITGYIPINLNAENNGLMLKGINFKAKTNPNAEIEALLVGAGLKIGPVAGSVDDFGAKLVIKEELNEANADFGGTSTKMSFVGPKGIFVEIKTKVIEGAGYLYISDDEYIGALSLTLNTKKFKIGITAIGIITVKMPDGGKGTAVLALIAVTFSPGIPLIWGFQLQGVGGLVGIHHTINTEALRSGVKEGTLDSILFPKIDVKNIQKIVSDLKTVFPIQRDQFLIGVMAKIVWPSVSPKLFIDFGLMVEFSNPVRLAIIGKLALRLGDDDSSSSSSSSKLIRITVAFVGIIDFEEKYMSFDASIYDSQIAFITLSGDMAMRLFWGDHKEFLMSVGGFHPAYDVPAYLKLPANMKRITIGLINGKVGPVEMRLILETYFAISTNTLQFGAKLDLYIKFWKLEIIGMFGFDVLFQFKPFRFISKVYAMLAVLFKGSEILCISMEVNLVGPGPWHADGNATFKVLCFKKTCKFEKTWGNQPQVPAEPPMPIEPMIVQDLQKSENWTAQLPDSSKSHVQLKPVNPGALVMDPLGNLSITQRAAPLGVQLNKYGEKQISDPGKYDIFEVVVNDSTSAPVVYNASQNTALFGESREDFAPTQFKSMNDDEKLKAKSFEYLRSGVKISNGELHTAGYIDRAVAYDIVIIDDEYVDATNTAVLFPRAFVNSLVRGGVLSSNSVSIAKNLDIVTPLVSVSTEKHMLIAADTLEPVQSGPNTIMANSLAEAIDVQNTLALNNLTELAYA